MGSQPLSYSFYAYNYIIMFHTNSFFFYLFIFFISSFVFLVFPNNLVYINTLKYNQIKVKIGLLYYKQNNTQTDISNNLPK